MEFNHHTKLSNNTVKQVLNQEFENLVQKSLEVMETGKLYLYDVLKEEYLKGYYIQIYDADEGINTFYFKKDGAEDPLVTGEFVYTEEQRQYLVKQNEIYEDIPTAPAMSVLIMPLGFIECEAESLDKLTQQIAQFEKLLGFILLTQYNLKNNIQ